MTTTSHRPHPAYATASAVPLVRSIPERCRVCYTCVRECPAKAIRILNGQADVVQERCIGCGNCVRVCSQGAKEVRGSIARAWSQLSSGEPVAALIAPSFPAEFPECDHRAVVGMLRCLGFKTVCETAFGADLVAAEYRRIMESRPNERFIASTCPAVVSFVEFYHPALVGRLMPVVSPMVAAARVLRAANKRIKIVFIGPCIAKKAEAISEDLDAEVDAVLTFSELREMLNEKSISQKNVMPSDFDPPHAGKGRMFALARGLLETAGIREELINTDVVASDGRESFIDAINEFELGTLNARLLEVLCCQGCIMGAGMTNRTMPIFKRRALVSAYVKDRLGDPGAAKTENPAHASLFRSFRTRDRRLPTPSDERINTILMDMGKFCAEDELNCGACGYPTCREHAVAIHKGLAEEQMCLPYTIEKLKETIQKLADSNQEVANIQNALVQSEKLASTGQLAAGVAHEVNNPLGIVLMYAHLLMERHAQTNPALAEDLGLIVAQADRCKRIISGLLDFARQNKVFRQHTNMRNLVENSLRSVNLPMEIETQVKSAAEDLMADIDPDQISQVLINLFTNAQVAMPRGGRLLIELSGDPETIKICVTDTGVGIPPENLSRIFDPFFTTKQIGNGTGLGLAVVYGIIKMHQGKITVESNSNPANGVVGTTFTVILPRREV